MRKIFIILCLTVVSLPVSRLYAHSPEKVALSYDQDARVLTAEVVHPVANPGRHYVDRVEVLLNGKRIVEKEPSRQDATGVTEVFPLTDVQSGDIVKVIAFCNRGGERSEQIQILSTDKPSSIQGDLEKR